MAATTMKIKKTNTGGEAFNKVSVAHAFQQMAATTMKIKKTNNINNKAYHSPLPLERGRG